MGNLITSIRCSEIQPDMLHSYQRLTKAGHKDLPDLKELGHKNLFCTVPDEQKYMLETTQD